MAFENHLHKSELQESLLAEHLDAVEKQRLGAQVCAATNSSLNHCWNDDDQLNLHPKSRIASDLNFRSTCEQKKIDTVTQKEQE